jgi:hypothetical protein
VSAKATAINIIGYLRPDTANISADCTGAPVPVCQVSWTDRSSHWRGRLTLDDEQWPFVGQRASNACLEHHGKGCWRSVKQFWGDE